MIIIFMAGNFQIYKNTISRIRGIKEFHKSTGEAIFHDGTRCCYCDSSAQLVGLADALVVLLPRWDKNRDIKMDELTSAAKSGRLIVTEYLDPSNLT